MAQTQRPHQLDVLHMGIGSICGGMQQGAWERAWVMNPLSGMCSLRTGPSLQGRLGSATS